MLKAAMLSLATICSQQALASILVVRSSEPDAKLDTTASSTSYSQPSVSTSTTANVNVAAPVITSNVNMAKPNQNDFDFNAPAYATVVSDLNKKLFTSTIPRSSNQRYFKISKKLPYEHCFYSSADKYGIPVDLLLAIAQTESSFTHSVTGRLGYGADHGLMQINDWWVPRLRKRFGITLNDIYDPCTNIEIASWILAHNFVQHGYSWRAVGAYNAVTESKRVIYIKKVSKNLQKLHAGKL